MNNISILYCLCLAGFILASCGGGLQSHKSLPKLGHRDIIDGDTIFHKVPDFNFTDQYGHEVSPKSLNGKAFILDYFFTSCPTICPKVKAQELRIFERYKDHPNLSIVSVSIDTKYDTKERLNNYATKLGVNNSNWHFVTGDKDMIYDNAVGFFHTAIENKDAPGGYDHDGKLVLIDKDRHIRGFCDGLFPEEVDDFFDDIENLLHEYK